MFFFFSRFLFFCSSPLLTEVFFVLCVVAAVLCHPAALIISAVGTWSVQQLCVAFLQQRCCPVLEEGGRERGLQVSGRRSPMYGSATELQTGERQKIIRVRQLL